MIMPYAKQFIDAADVEAVSTALQSPIITRGSAVSEFEEEIANYCGAKYAVAFNSGSTALLAAYQAAQTNAADRILTTPNTFVASVSTGMELGATPIFVDIDRKTGNLNLEQVQYYLREYRSSRGRTIIVPVHFSGIPVDMELIDKAICDPDAIVIEDAAHAFGSKYKNGKRVGCCDYSHMTIFSFHPAKTITTGEGGMVLTNDSELNDRLRLFRNNGIQRNPEKLVADEEERFEGYYEVVEMSGNYNFTDFQAALGLSQFQKLDSFIAKRRELITEYRRLLRDFPYVRLFSEEQDENTAFHIFVVQIDFAAFNTTRAHVVSALKEKGIGTQVHYIPVYRHPFFANKNGDLTSYFPEMEKYYSQALTLPLYYSLEADQVKFVVNSLKDILVAEREKKIKKKFPKR